MEPLQTEDGTNNWGDFDSGEEINELGDRWRDCEGRARHLCFVSNIRRADACIFCTNIDLMLILWYRQTWPCWGVTAALRHTLQAVSLLQTSFLSFVKTSYHPSGQCQVKGDLDQTCLHGDSGLRDYSIHSILGAEHPGKKQFTQWFSEPRPAVLISNSVSDTLVNIRACRDYPQYLNYSSGQIASLYSD